MLRSTATSAPPVSERFAATSDLLESLLSGRRVDPDEIQAAYREVASAIGERTAAYREARPGWGRREAHANGAPWPTPGPAPANGARRRPPPPPEPEPPAGGASEADLQRARAELGFGPRDLITREVLRQRQRELAKRHHPDRGGSTQRMQEINRAVDILAGSL